MKHKAGNYRYTCKVSGLDIPLFEIYQIVPCGCSSSCEVYIVDSREMLDEFQVIKHFKNMDEEFQSKLNGLLNE